MSNKYTEFKYGWPVVVASMFGIALGMSPLPFYTLGVFIGPYTQEFGWSVDTILSAFTVFTLCAMFLGPTVGHLADKIGVRKVVLVAIPLFSLGLMAMALNNGSVVLYLFLWGLLATLGVGTLPITFTRAVNRWFHDSRGLALGIALIGTGLSGFLSKLLVAALIPVVGWRGAYVGLGLLPLLISWPIAFFMFHDTDDEKAKKRVEALAAAREIKLSPNPGGMELGEALTNWRFWLLAYSFLPLSFIIGGPIPGIEHIMTNEGFSTEQAVALGTFVPLSVVAGRLIGGILIDHFWAPAVSAIILTMPILFCLVIRSTDPSFAMVAMGNISLGLAAGVEYDLLAFLVSKYFGLKRYAAIYGFMYAIFGLGAGFGPWLYGLSFEATGSYDTILGYALFVIPLAALPLLALGRYQTYPPED
ncbi:MAG: MFS transporter [Woeseiaceae bacterium]